MSEHPLAAAPPPADGGVVRRAAAAVGLRLDPAGRFDLVGVDTEQVLGVLEREHARALPTEILGAYVDVARHRGAGWQELATRLGVSSQATHQRFQDNVARYTPQLHGHGVLDRAEAARRLRSSGTAS